LRDDLGSRKAVSTGIRRNRSRSRSPWDVLAELVTSEGAERKVRSTRYQLAIAVFPLTKALTGVDFARSPVNEMMVCDLHEGHFMEAARNVVFVGGPRSGKSLATAIGMNAIRTEPRAARGFLRLLPDCPVPGGLETPSLARLFPRPRDLLGEVRNPEMVAGAGTSAQLHARKSREKKRQSFKALRAHSQVSVR